MGIPFALTIVIEAIRASKSNKREASSRFNGVLREEPGHLDETYPETTTPVLPTRRKLVLTWSAVGSLK
jgi:hypothetical protein